MKKYHVYSKLAAAVAYVDWTEGGGDMPIQGETVHINGGAGVASKHLITPMGVHTEITEAQVEILNRNGIFKIHKANGFVTIETSKGDVEKVVADMAEGSDKSSPLTPADYENAGENSPAPRGVKNSRKKK